MGVIRLLYREIFDVIFPPVLCCMYFIFACNAVTFEYSPVSEAVVVLLDVKDNIITETF